MRFAGPPDRRRTGGREPAQEWTAYWNGRFVPEGEVRISPSDRGFILGDAVYEVTRTYRHRPFHLDWHLERLYASLAAIRLDPLISPDEMRALSEEILTRNLALVPPSDDVSLTQRITRGLHTGPFETARQRPPTVLITCRPVRFAPFAMLYRDGAELQTPPLEVPVRGGVDPRIKTHSRLQFALGAVMVAAPGRTILPVFTDVEGWITETASANVFFVRGHTLQTAPDTAVLGGITRRAVLELAAAEGLRISLEHARLDAVAGFDEAFITATSFAILPVRRLNEHGFTPIPGPVTARLTGAFSAAVGVDIIQQAQQAGADPQPTPRSAGRSTS